MLQQASLRHHGAAALRSLLPFASRSTAPSNITPIRNPSRAYAYHLLPRGFKKHKMQPVMFTPKPGSATEQTPDDSIVQSVSVANRLVELLDPIAGNVPSEEQVQQLLQVAQECKQQRKYPSKRMPVESILLAYLESLSQLQEKDCQQHPRLKELLAPQSQEGLDPIRQHLATILCIGQGEWRDLLHQTSNKEQETSQDSKNLPNDVGPLRYHVIFMFLSMLKSVPKVRNPLSHRLLYFLTYSMLFRDDLIPRSDVIKRLRTRQLFSKERQGLVVLLTVDGLMNYDPRAAAKKAYNILSIAVDSIDDFEGVGKAVGLFLQRSKGSLYHEKFALMRRVEAKFDITLQSVVISNLIIDAFDEQVRTNMKAPILLEQLFYYLSTERPRVFDDILLTRFYGTHIWQRAYEVDVRLDPKTDEKTIWNGQLVRARLNCATLRNNVLPWLGVLESLVQRRKSVPAGQPYLFGPVFINANQRFIFLRTCEKVAELCEQVIVGMSQDVEQAEQATRLLAEFKEIAKEQLAIGDELIRKKLEN